MSENNDRMAWIKGGSALCAVTPSTSNRAPRLVMLGPPGVGKGTQAELLCHKLGACHLSTGDIFRAAKTIPKEQRTPSLESALTFMAHGDLVPDTTVLGIVAERLRCLRCGGGFLLDGFPRTIAQATALAQLLKKEGVSLTAVINYDLPIDKVVERLAGRRTCGGCKAVFHVTTRPPAVEGICDHCGAKLLQREDDRPESIRIRMEAYEQSTKPLIDFYRKCGLLISIAATGSPEDICARTLAALKTQASPAKDPLLCR